MILKFWFKQPGGWRATPRVKKTEGTAGLKERSGQGGHQLGTCINPSLLCSTLLVVALWELRQLQKLSSVADHLSNPSSPAGPTDRARGILPHISRLFCTFRTIVSMYTPKDSLWEDFHLPIRIPDGFIGPGQHSVIRLQR